MQLSRELVCRRCAAGHAADSQPFELPGAKATWVPDRVVDVRHIRLEVGLDFSHKRVDGVCTLTLVPLNTGPTRVELNAVEMTIHAVTLGDGGELPHRYDGKVLSVDLGERAESEELQLYIRYTAQPRRGLYFLEPDAGYPERPRQVWSQGQDEDNRHWFPCFDHPHEKSTSEVRVTVPREMTALSNGELVEETAGDATRTLHFRQEVPHSSYLITLVAGEFSVLEDRLEDVRFYYYVPKARLDDAARSFANTPKMVKLFAELTGQQYPYGRYSQIAVADFIFGGMENTSATTMTESTLHDARAHLDFSSEPLVAHELAHQWFGDLLTCRTWSEGWLNEGFATFFEILWKEASAGRDEGDYDRLADMEAYFDEAGGRYQRPIVTNVFHEPIDVFDRHLYEKGAAVLHMLRHELGETRFWKAIRLYVARHAGGNVETRDLVKAIGDATGWNGDRFFAQWVMRAGHPSLVVEHGWDEKARMASVTVEQKQSEAWYLPLTVRFVVDGQPRDAALVVSDKKQTLLVPMHAAPTQVIVDPGHNYLLDVDEKKSEALWREQLAHAERAIDRVMAARALGKAGEQTALADLVKAMRGDKSWIVRAEAALALGSLKREAARDAIAVAVAEEPHPKARRSLVRALANFRHDERAADAALATLGRDASYFVEAEAATTLAATRSPKAYAALVEATTRKSFQEVLAGAAIGGIAEMRDERGIDVALPMSEWGRPSPMRRAAVSALGRLGGLYAGRRPLIRERLEELLEDPDFRVRIAAVEALRVLGDVAANAALGRAERLDLDGRVRRRAREVARLLGQSAASDENARGWRDVAEKLEGEAQNLRARLEKIEARLEPPPTTTPQSPPKHDEDEA
jgi:aminopeptidase N